MLSLPSERDPDTAYRVYQAQFNDNEFMYGVTVFSKEGASTAPEILYRFDMLPQWMQDAIATLDTAGPNVGVPGLGRKIGSTYWIGKGLDGELFGL